MSSILEHTAGRKAGLTRARYVVIAFILGLALVTYLDRACMGTLSPQFQKEFHLTDPQMSWVFSAFAIAYAAFEVPTAWWAHRRGTRRVLTRIVVWWSLLTFATAAAFTPELIARLIPGWGAPAHAGGTATESAPSIVGSNAWLMSFWLLLAIRFLFGMGEAGAWPCAAASYARWIPARERGMAQGLLFAGAHLGGWITPILVVFLRDTLQVPWRFILVLFGAIGLVWAAGWYFWFRDDPAEHKSVGEEELKKIVEGRRPQTEEHGGWRYVKKLFLNRNVVPLCLMYIGNSYAYYFCITWLPRFLEEKHGFEKTWLGVAAGLPFGLAVVGDIFGGFTTDYMGRRFGLRVGRSMLGATCYGLAAICTLLAALASHPWVAIGCLSVAVMAVMFTLGAAWGTVIDISGNHTGMVGAVMNTAGNTAAIFSAPVAIYTRDNWGGWNAPLYVIGSLFVVGAISWLFVDPNKPIFGRDDEVQRGFPVEATP